MVSLLVIVILRLVERMIVINKLHLNVLIGVFIALGTFSLLELKFVRSELVFSQNVFFVDDPLFNLTPLRIVQLLVLLFTGLN